MKNSFEIKPKNKQLKIKLFLILNTISCMLYAQQSPMFTHYMYNTLVVNPAYAGSRDALTITALGRTQWVDFTGAPTTQSISMHTPLKNQPIGIGFAMLNDKIGPVNNTSIIGDIAYKFKLSEKDKLSIGMSIGINVLQAQLNTLQLDQEVDPSFQYNVKNRITPNYGVGIYYARERFYAGISSPNLIENKLFTNNATTGTILASKEQRHYFFIAGAVMQITDNIAFKPTTLIKATAGAPVQVDLTAAFILRQKLTLGAMIRSQDALGVLVGFDLIQNLHLGYAYDWSYGLRTFTYNQGSHELMLRYDFLTSTHKQIHSPRYF